MPAKMRKAVFDRAHHEQLAIEAVESAKRELPATWACTTAAVYATVRANRDITRARVHLAAIGGHEGSRTQKLWSAVSKGQRDVDVAADRLARCVLSLHPDAREQPSIRDERRLKTAGILGRARARRRRKR